MIKEIVANILKEKKIHSIYFVACGGSIAAFYPAKYFLEKESNSLCRIGFYSANEFVHTTPVFLDEKSLVVICSHQGATPETIEAGQLSKERGATVIGFTYVKNSKITKISDYSIYYSWGEDVIFSKKKECLGLLLVVELLHQLEGWSNYEHVIRGFSIYDNIASEARKNSVSEAERFAELCKSEKIIYTLGSGACFGSAYIETVCILLEMQWINSAYLHSGEFFHGPLEITDNNVPFIVFVGDGMVRALDERLINFLEKYAKKTYVLDAKKLGIEKIHSSVTEYFSPLLLTAVIDVFNHKLAEVRHHPLTTRRYMWKVEY